MELPKSTCRPWVISPEDEAYFRAIDPTMKWLKHLPQDVLHKYAGQWIAAKDCQIIDSAPTLEALFARLTDADLETVVTLRIEHAAWTIRR